VSQGKIQFRFTGINDESIINYAYFIKSLREFIDSGVHFHDHVDDIFSRSIKFALKTFPFSSPIFSDLIIFRTSKLECVPVMWNFIMSTDASKLERIQRKFPAICYYYFLHSHYGHVNALDNLNRIPYMR